MLLLALSGAAGLALSSDPAQPELVAVIRDRALPEISGIASSRQHPGVLWVHNDSGFGPWLHAIDARGRRLASLRIEGVAAVDPEDLASFELDGRRLLLLADVGDNGGLRQQVELVVVEEPAELADGVLQPAWVQRFRWPDGPRDVEAVAVDPVAREVLLISKKRVPPELYALPLGPAEGVQQARRLGELSGIQQPQPEDLAANPRFGRYRAQITAADLSSDGRALAVLNYRRLHVYRRQPGEPWSEAVARPPAELPFGWLAQAEAVGFSDDDAALWITGERLPAPLIRVTVPGP
ncbi:MAG: hypothetical protein MEQ07_07190 [Aquimonas sp.]|nr:hypothetical protein [Aquimonas sp.]